MKILVILALAFSFVWGGNIKENSADSISLDEKIKSMIMVGLGQNADFANSRYAGFILLFSKDFNSSAELKKITSKIHNMGLKIAIDEEGGKVSRLEKLGFITKSAKELSQIAQEQGDKEAKKAYSTMAKNLKEHGIDINFAPVLDLDSENSPIIGALGRAFSKDPKQVAKMARIFIKEHDKFDIATSLKHFVGHGDAIVDTHKGIGIAKADRKALLPYKMLIKSKDAKSIMISHLKITNIDKNNPASLSKALIDGFLREKMNFDGVVFSDDMMMGALNDFSLEEKVVGFINAGGDIMIFSASGNSDSISAKIIFEIIKKAVNDGKISADRIDKSYKRIQKLFG